MPFSALPMMFCLLWKRDVIMKSAIHKRLFVWSRVVTDVIYAEAEVDAEVQCLTSAEAEVNRKQRRRWKNNLKIFKI